MGTQKRSILVLERDPELLPRFSSAFHRSGYDVFVTDRVDQAAAMVNGSGHACCFDLVVVDISNDQHRKFAAEVANRNNGMPVFTLKHARDKSMLIDLLNHKQTAFIECYINSHCKASHPRNRGR